MSLEDALALAGVTEEGLYLALAEQYDPAGPGGPQGRPLHQDPDLEGFRMGGDGQPLFYLTARSDDREDSAADAVSGRSTSISGPLGPSPAIIRTTSTACPLWSRRRSA